MSDYIGSNWGNYINNVDHETGIHYGVISGHMVSSWSLEDMEPNYGDPTCPECNGPVLDADNDTEEINNIEEYEAYTKYSCQDYVCSNCEIFFSSEHAYPEEPQGSSYESEDLQISQSGDDRDLFITKSPYYTLCAYCSPCAPNAGYLTDQRENGIKSYCLPLEWFDKDDNSPCPYKIYKVSDDSLVYSPEEKEDTE